MTRLLRLAAAVLLLTAVGTLAQPVQVLTVTTSDGTSLVCRRMRSGKTVTLVFTHSMYGGEVRETWHVDGGMLARERIVADNAAAAEYYATDGETRRVDDGYEVISPPIHVEALSLRIDQIGEHRLRFGDEEISLAARVDETARATISAAQVPLIGRIVAGDAGCGR